MKKIAFLINLCLFALIFKGFAQEEILLTIGEKNITKEEFVRIYEKNNSPELSLTTSTPQEYLNLFINFKLKVIEAENLGLDTAQKFIDELNMYRDELVKPYLTNNDMYEQLIKEAYERKKNEVRINYIFFEMPVGTKAKDTVEIYNNALNVYKKLAKGEDYEKVTTDSTLKITSSGDAWYLSSLTAPYQIENFMFNNKNGSISKPLREKNGYYIIKVIDKRQNPGQVKVAHIMVALPENSSQETETAAKEKIDMIAEKLKNGEDFATLAKEYSDDKFSGTNGGDLNWFGTGAMIQPFEEAAFALKNAGDISEPVRTFYGWHIIKKYDSKEVETFDEMYEDLSTKVLNDTRYELCEKTFVDKLKTEYNFKELSKSTNFYTIVDSTIYKAKWDVSTAKNLNSILFTIADLKITEQDFANYLNENQKWQYEKDINEFIDNEYETFVNEEIKEYEKSNLENKYPDFKSIMQEYHDGILLFGLQEEEVWNKAVNDTIGLENYYQQIKNNYMADKKMRASIYSYSSESYMKKAQKVLKKNISIQLPDSTIVQKVDKTGENFKIISQDTFEKGTNDTIDMVFTKYETNEIQETEKIVTLPNSKIIVAVYEIIPSQPKELSEIKGLVISEYQTILEDKWIEELKNKYKITINDEVLKSIK